MQPGSQLGHYQIVEKIGEGGMGVVYKARDLKLERFVALKVLPEAMVADPERVRRFEQEAKTASALNHPNIVTIHDIAVQDGVRFIVMEYIKGRTLDQLIPKGGMARAQALGIAVQVADAVAAAAASGVTHRDLKPGNIMVTDSGLVKLLDFGLAKLTEPVAIGADDATVVATPKTKEGVIAGTVDYMSPEQAEGRAVDARSDIFSFGAVLYEMLSGAKPFTGATPMAVLGAIMHQDPKSIAGLPVELDQLLGRAMRKDQARRFQTMADLRAALVDVKEESFSGLRAAGRQHSNSAGKWILGAVSLAVLVAGGYWLASRLRISGEPSAPMKVVPLTALEGLEQQPTFSPDGNQVAFSWQRTPETKFAIHVRMLSGGAPVRLTVGDQLELCPQWSPDGQWIAFTRQDPGTNTNVLYLLSPVSRQERRLVDTELTSTACLHGWHPNGKKLAIGIGGEAAGLYAVSVESGQRQRLTPPEIRRASRATFSPDGRRIAFHGALTPAESSISHIGLMDLTEDTQPMGPPRKIFQLSTVNSMAWLPDGNELLVSTSTEGSRLLRVPAAGGTARQVDIPGLGPSFTSFALTGTTSQVRLAVTQVVEQVNIWRHDVDERGKGIGTPRKLFATTQREDFPTWSPDGKRIAFVSRQTGESEVWMADGDGANMTQLTRGGQNTQFLFWSPDGKRLLRGLSGENRGTLQLISVEGGGVQAIRTRANASHAQGWSRDGAIVYFASHGPAGAEGVWRVRLDGSGEEKVLDVAAHFSAESADGRGYYYLDEEGVWKKPLSGGGLAELVVKGRVNAFSLTKEGVFYRRGRAIYFHHLVRGSDKLAFPVAGPSPQLSGVMSVSWDGRVAAVVNQESANSDLMLVENFR